FFNFRQIDARKIASTNLLERLNREIRRRTKVVGIFPSMDSYIRLVTSYLIEYSEDWSSGRSYINPMLINEIQQQLSKSA
ncbi:transposase, partial [Anaeromusa acidaminophila]